MEDHLRHLEIVLQLLHTNKLYVKLSKCDLGQPQIEYLGHVITGGGLSTNPSKIAAMVNGHNPGH